MADLSDLDLDEDKFVELMLLVFYMGTWIRGGWALPPWTCPSSSFAARHGRLALRYPFNLPWQIAFNAVVNFQALALARSFASGA